MKKMFLTLYLALSVLITVNCRTVPSEIELPPKPQREKLEEPKDIKDYAVIIAYYESLVSLWENWGDYVTHYYDKEKAK